MDDYINLMDAMYPPPPDDYYDDDWDELRVIAAAEDRSSWLDDLRWRIIAKLVPFD